MDLTDASPQEKEHLERAHHEICTALTVLRSNVELVRVELIHARDPAAHIIIHRHLSELDLAVDRLHRLATQMRSWHTAAPSGVPAPAGTTARTSLLPLERP